MLKRILAAAVFCAATMTMTTATAKNRAEEVPIEIRSVAFSPKGLSGIGGERLRSQIGDAQSVALGVDHGFADSPILARALGAEMRKLHQPIYHTAEIGPLTAVWLQQRLAEGGVAGLRAVADGLNGKAMAMPFTRNVEDQMLAADFPNVDGRPRFWGIDQEFMGAPMVLMDAIANQAPDVATKNAVSAIGEADGAAGLAGLLTFGTVASVVYSRSGVWLDGALNPHDHNSSSLHILA